MTPLNDDTNICLSGGADGADVQWGMCAGYAGHLVKHFGFNGHRSMAPQSEIVILTQDQLDLVDPFLVEADKTLKRWYPGKRSQFVKNLLRRNYYQVAWSDSVYAVAGLDGKGVTGGTGWAVQMFIDRFNGEACPAYVFNQEEDAWYKFNGADMVRWCHLPEGPPVPTGVWAGIGSRDLKQNGKEAIRKLMGYVANNTSATA